MSILPDLRFRTCLTSLIISYQLPRPRQLLGALLACGTGNRGDTATPKQPYLGGQIRLGRRNIDCNCFPEGLRMALEAKV